jgi:flagellar assembly protein FliH
MSSSSRVIKLARLANGVRVIPSAPAAEGGAGGADQPEELCPQSGPAAGEGDAAHQAGFEAGFQAGFEAGLAEGRQAAAAEAAEYLRRLRGLVESARLEHRRILREAEQQLLILALAAAEKVLSRKLEEGDRRLMADFIAEALREAEETTHSPEAVVVRVNPQDFEFVCQLTSAAGEAGCPRVIADPRVEAGGCVVETSAAVIDSTPTERLRQVARLLRQAHELEHRP